MFNIINTRNKYFLLIVVFIVAWIGLGFQNGNAQTIDWVRQFGGGIPDDVASAAAADGSVYAAGFTLGTLPGQTSSGLQDAFVRKYDVNGVEQWTQQFGTISSEGSLGISVDSSDVYVVGLTNGAFPGYTNLV